MKYQTILSTLIGLSSAAIATEYDLELLRIHNQMRQDPESFIPELENIITDFAGTKSRLIQIGTQQVSFITNEGNIPVLELITFLRNQGKLQPLALDENLKDYACQHVNDQGATRAVGHLSTAGNTWNERIQNLKEDKYVFGENLSYGVMSPRDAILTLAIDDGIKTRGHRLNLFKTDWEFIGVCNGPHEAYGTMVDIIYKGNEGSGDLWTAKLAIEMADRSSLLATSISNKNALKDSLGSDGRYLIGSSCKQNANGGRPKCSAGLCCGAGLKTGAIWTTQIESCQKDTDKTYTYYTVAGVEVWDFVCIDGANHLKLISSAFASALAVSLMLI